MNSLFGQLFDNMDQTGTEQYIYMYELCFIVSFNDISLDLLSNIQTIIKYSRQCKL